MVVNATEFKNGLGKYLEIALSGKEIEITKYNRVVAKLMPVGIPYRVNSNDNKTNEQNS